MKPYIFITGKLPEEGIQALADWYDIHMWEKAETACTL